jgi:hypothetical protein
MAVPLRPQHQRAMPRNWAAEPEKRVIEHMMYRRARYGQSIPPPESRMIRNMRQQELYRQPAPR